LNKAILNKEVQEFIRGNLKTDLSKLILKGSPFKNITIQEIAVQIQALQKVKTKLPTFFYAENIIFPPNISLEQTSSEITAKYKASLIGGSKAIDITGGFGIDAFFIAENFEKLLHCEIDPHLSEIAAHNFKVLERENIETFSGNGIDFLETTSERFDWIYIDPARRDSYGGKVFLLGQCTPNIPENLDLFFQKTNNILIKTSPLLDITAGLKELAHVTEIHIVSVNNEVKELLWIIKKSYSGEILIKSINFLKEGVQNFQGVYDDRDEIPLSLPQKYLFEPNPAVMKSELFSALAAQTGSAKLHPHSHLFTNDVLIDFPGRRFSVVKIIPYSRKELKKELKIKKANITTRNFPKTVETLRKELKISEGGNYYLFFTTNLNNDKIVLVCEKAGEF